MPTDLVTSAEVSASWAGFSALDAGEQSALIAAASRAVEAHLGRAIGSAARDEVATPDGRDGTIFLRHYPVASISRISAGLEVALSITNTDAAVDLAVAEMATTGAADDPTYTGLVLTRVASGTTTVSSTLAFATYKTLATLAAAVANLGAGWAATVGAGLDNFPSAQLWKQVGARGAASPDSADFPAFVEDIQAIEVRHESGTIVLPRRPRSDRRVRVQYAAGYATADVPAAIKRATLQTIRYLAGPAGSGQGVVKSSFGDRSYELAAPSASGIPAVAASLLGPFRDRRSL